MVVRAKSVDEDKQIADLIPGEDVIPLMLLIPKRVWEDMKRIAEEDGVDGMTLVSRAIAEYIEGR